MKIAFISDIHGNAVALEAVLKDIEEKKVDKIIVIGDICYRGPDPQKALSLVRSLNTTVLKGNADEWVVRGVREGEVPDQALDMMNRERDWTVSQLTASDIDYLKDLPKEHSIKLTDEIEIHAFHATPTSLFHVVPNGEKEEVIKEKLMTRPTSDIFIYGHIHYPYIRFFDSKAVANTGSVGLPFDGLSLASYLIVEGQGNHFNMTIQRVPYDTEKVVKQYEENDYPNIELMTKIIRDGKLPT